MEVRQLHLVGATGVPRTETYDGREHLVVPVTMLIGDNVVHAVNAPAAELVLASALSAQGWNGRPLVLGHPTEGGKQISANDPRVMERQGFGFLAEATLKGKKLGAEAWMDVAKLEKLGQGKMLADARAGKPIEVSVGAFVSTDNVAGMHAGRQYKARWQAMTPDHLAFLPGGLGACSIEMGCGANRAAMRICGDSLEFEVMPKVKTSVGKLKARILAIFDTPEQAASEEAAELIAYRSMRTMLDGVGDQYDEASGLIDDLISDEDDNPTTTPGQEEAEEEVEDARLTAVRMLCYSMISSLQNVCNVTYAQQEPDLPPTGDLRYNEALRAAIGKAISAANMKTIQKAHDSSHEVHAHTVALGAACNGMKLLEAAEPHIRAAACRCEGETMSKADQIKAILAGGKKDDLTAAQVTALEGLPDAVIGVIHALAAKSPADGIIQAKSNADAALAAHAHGLNAKDQADAAAAAKKKEDDDAAAAGDQAKDKKMKAAKAAGFETVAAHEEAEFLAAHPSLKTLVDKQKQQDADRKSELVAVLKAAGALTEEQLKSKSLEDLEVLARFAKVERNDFSGRGLAHDEKDVFLNPPDPYAEALKRRREAASN